MCQCDRVHIEKSIGEVFFLCVQELRKKGPLNAMNVFSGMSAASDRPEPHDKSGDESR